VKSNSLVEFLNRIFIGSHSLPPSGSPLRSFSCVVAGLLLAGLDLFWLGFVKGSSSLQVVFCGCFCSRA
jgi:hypothetical protein